MTDHRKREIAKHVDAIERLKALIEFGEDRSEFSEQEIAKLKHDLKRERRILIDMMNNEELMALKAAGHDAENCLKIVRNDPAPPAPTELTKALAAIAKANRQREQQSRYSAIYVAEKGYEMPTGAFTLSDLAKRDSRVAVTRLKSPSTTKADTASLSNTVLRHRRDI